MVETKFSIWMNGLKTAWESRNPKAIINLCANKFKWYETPFDKPYTTHRQLLRDWQGILKQSDISFLFKIIFSDEFVGIAHWSVVFNRIPNNRKVKLDGIFKVTLNGKGKCTEFHQWYHSKI